MPFHMKTSDAWSRTIVMMHSCMNPAGLAMPPREVHALRDKAADAFGDALVVSVIERPTPTTATICWRDPTRCSYRDQSWRIRRARRRGRCAMSGESIAAGDFVYAPIRTSSVCNGHAMILASVIEQYALS
ncbi:hypothetical protein AWB70_03472 [Caballeronia cordobensis]|uniref:DUF3331 domain-containing protein n=2 Tax=Caballeronia cordobensis TaxID=1353886 RepID=A0A158HLW4_CABCO|nr:hypothetical protein AWB70_03472 [Caballeronia cordobensis]